MHMHATPCDGTLQKVLIRKLAFIVEGHCHGASAIRGLFSSLHSTEAIG